MCCIRKHDNIDSYKFLILHNSNSSICNKEERRKIKCLQLINLFEKAVLISLKSMTLQRLIEGTTVSKNNSLTLTLHKNVAFVLELVHRQLRHRTRDFANMHVYDYQIIWE